MAASYVAAEFEHDRFVVQTGGRNHQAFVDSVALLVLVATVPDA